MTARLLRCRAVRRPAEELLAAARAGDEGAWRELVDRYAGVVWSVARGVCTDRGLAADVSQTVWLRLAEHLDTIQDPERLPGWLATTTRREAYRAVRHARRTQPLDDLDRHAAPVATGDAEPGERLERAEEAEAVRRAYVRLGEACQELLRLLTVEPRLDYQTIATMLGRPIGSLGPTRARCLATLRQHYEQALEGA